MAEMGGSPEAEDKLGVKSCGLEHGEVKNRAIGRVAIAVLQRGVGIRKFAQGQFGE